ncbi:transmembrane protein 207 [Cricetulus griseus]|uniref:Transmembrane protein 207 n=1 Tax=Cricetulus griseus TaxID=10029 RepID=A0A8C2LMQ7_CRIGR|nr:transmembrane protein 207 [Cricetulus griseus]XP_027269169.1 transmembrane protein 207 [Cricetulus griseus]
MSRSSPFRVTSKIPTTGSLCLPLFQLVLSDVSCEENETCVNYNDQHPDAWYIWFLLWIFLVVLLCGIVLLCLRCWLKRCRIDHPRRTMAVFAIGDLDLIHGTEMAGNPSVRISLPTPNTELCPALRFGDLGPPPPYEETLKTS